MSNDTQEVGAEVVKARDKMYQDLFKVCRDLNMDEQTEKSSSKKLKEVDQRCTLERADGKKWVACAIYEGCRQSTTPTVSGQDAHVRGNGVSLNNLLRSCQMSIFDFKVKIRQWCDMASPSDDFVSHIEEVDRKFSISFTLHKYHKKTFEQLFIRPLNEKKHTKNSSLHSKCSYIKLFDISWLLYLCAKNQKPTTTVDLVSSFNLMMCCLDLIYLNVLAEKRTDLIKPDFEGLPATWGTPEFTESAASEHCILKYFCEMTEEAKTMKATVFNKIIQAFFQANTIYGNKDTMLGLVSNEHFERNTKSLNFAYEQYVLSVGEFDERILATCPLDSGEQNHLTEQALRQPVTPLTRKQDLPAQTAMSEQKFEPVANATNNVKQLSFFRGITGPTDFVKQAGDEVTNKILNDVKQMEQKFHKNYPSEDRNRFELAKSIFFYLLDQILRAEAHKKPNIHIKRLLATNIALETLNITLLACCVELVLYAYSSDTEIKFPWILDCFDIKAFQFHKIIEIVVRHGGQPEGRLQRALIKHLNSIEETCLERLVWSSESPVWDLIQRAAKPLPTWAQVNNEKTAGQLQIFFRKVYLLGWLRIQKLCSELSLCEKKPDKIWTIFEHSITQKTELMQDRHLDQIIMCAIYIFIRVTKMQEPKFSDIMKTYRNQPQAVNSVYREVIIKIVDGELIKSDIISFYNQIYVPLMKTFSINYLNENVDKAELLLSPHPNERSAVPKKLTQNHSLFVSHMPKTEIQQSPGQMIYEFYHSPAKDLQLMNEKVRGGGKRVLRFNDEPGVDPIDQKRTRVLPSHLNQIKAVMHDREQK